MSKLAKLLALSVLLVGCNSVTRHEHTQKHDAQNGANNVENQVTKNVTNLNNHVAKNMANTASVVTNAAKKL